MIETPSGSRVVNELPVGSAQDTQNENEKMNCSLILLPYSSPRESTTSTCRRLAKAADGRRPGLLEASNRWFSAWVADGEEGGEGGREVEKGDEHDLECDGAARELGLVAGHSHDAEIFHSVITL